MNSFRNYSSYGAFMKDNGPTPSETARAHQFFSGVTSREARRILDQRVAARLYALAREVTHYARNSVDAEYAAALQREAAEHHRLSTQE